MPLRLALVAVLGLLVAAPAAASAATPTCVVVAHAVQAGYAPHGPADCLSLP